MGMEITGLGGLVLLGLDIWAVVSVLGASVSPGRKAIWILLILILPLLGFVIWLLAGPRAARVGG